MDTRIINIGQLVTPLARDSGTLEQGSSLHTIENTTLVTRNGRIASIDGSDERFEGETIDADGAVVLPGLADPHCHYRGVPASPLPEGEGARGALVPLLRRLAASGVTTVGMKCIESAGVFDELSELKHAARGHVPRIVASLSCASGDASDSEPGSRLAAMIGGAIPTVRTRRLAQFCDVAIGDGGCSVAEGRAILRAARGAGLRLKVSAAGGDIEDALRMAAKLEATSVDFCATPAAPSIERLRSVDVIPVVLPARSFVSGAPPPDVRPMLDCGLAVALGTEQGLSSPGVGSIWMILALAVTQLAMTLDEAITACTYHGARALGLGSETGSLEVGKKADLVILDVGDYRELLGSLGRNPVRLAFVEGRAIR